MAPHLRVSVFILWLTLAFSALSICRGDIRDIVTKDIFYKILYGDITLSAEFADSVTVFSGILSLASDNCTGKNFYRYSDFINATSAFPNFGTTRASDYHKREIAAFFANVAFCSRNLCYTEAINKTASCGQWKDCCVTLPTHLRYPCTAGKQYYGRGPLQLTYNDNYANAGRDLGFDGLNDPDIVTRDGIISWKTALWLWMQRTDAHSAITYGQGFGGTIKAVLGETYCNGEDDGAFSNLVTSYSHYCSQLSVNVTAIGTDLVC